MSRSPVRRSLFIIMIIAVGLIVFFLNANTGVTKDELNSQVRMSVDPHVLPSLKGDATEAPEVNEPDPSEGVEVAPVVPAEPELSAMPEEQTPVEPSVPAPAPVAETSPEPKPAPAASSASGTIESIQITETDTGFIVAVKADKPIGDTSYMNLFNPRRLVIDLREKWDSNVKNVVRTQGGPVKHIVLGMHPDRLRLVVYFNTPPAGKLDPQFEREGNSLKVSVQTR